MPKLTNFYYTPLRVRSKSELVGGDLPIFKFVVSDTNFLKFKKEINAICKDIDLDMNEDAEVMPLTLRGIYHVVTGENEVIYKFRVTGGQTLVVDIYRTLYRNLKLDPTFKCEDSDFVLFATTEMDFTTGEFLVTSHGNFDKCSYEGTRRFIKIDRENTSTQNMIREKQETLETQLYDLAVNSIQYFNELNSCINTCSALRALEPKHSRVSCDVRVRGERGETAPSSREIEINLSNLDGYAEISKAVMRLINQVKYSTPEWVVRGHFRRINDAIVYVKSHTKKRKVVELEGDLAPRKYIGVI